MRKRIVSVSFFLIPVMALILTGLFFLNGPDFVEAGNEPVKPKGEKSTGGLLYVADMISVQGEGLKVKRDNGPHWLRGCANMADYQYDILETDGNTLACLEFHNGSQIGINKNTKIKIISSTKAQDITNRSVVEKVVLDSGTMWAKIRGQKSTFDVQTGKGTLGVKGTEFLVTAEPKKDEEELTVLEGRVDFTPTGGKAMILKKGDSLAIRKGKRLQVIKNKIEELKKRLESRFPDLDPQTQMALGVFLAHMRWKKAARTKMAMKNAVMLGMMMKDPDKFREKMQEEDENKQRQTEQQKKQRFRRNLKILAYSARQPKNLKPGGSTVNTYYPSFTWEPVKDADQYWVLVAQADMYQGKREYRFYMFAKTNGCELTYPSYARALKPGESYLWTVIPVKNDKPFGYPAKLQKFTLAPYGELGIKGLYPTGGIEPPGKDMAFDWTPVKGVSRYRIEISDSRSFDKPLISRDVDTSYLVVNNGADSFAADKEYYWKVTPLAGGPSSMSGVINQFKVRVDK